MTRALLVAAFLVGTASVAAAGPYAGLGIGPAPGVSSNTDGLEENGRSIRILGGYRFKVPKIGSLSAEVALTDYDSHWTNGDYSTRHLALFGKYNFPLASGFEVFGRLGVQNTWQSIDDGSGSFSGGGVAVGAGAEYIVTLPFASGSIFVDYTITHSSELEDGNYSMTSRQWMLGLTVGF